MAPSAPLEAILTRGDWQMRLGERAAIRGLLAASDVDVAIELGTYRAGSLSLLAAHAGHVHTFDLTSQVEPSDFPNATFHVGDSHVLLPEVLEALSSAGQQIGFALVDGDHSPEGVRRDLLDLLDSPAFAEGYIVLHDTGNTAVRRGIESVPFAAHAKVARVDLDFVPPPPRTSAFAEQWAGLGLVVLEKDRRGPGATPERAVPRRDDLRAPVIEARRRVRRAVGLGLRRAGLHPAQRRGRG